MGESVIQGYLFETEDLDHPRNNTVCQILRRAQIGDAWLLDLGCAFQVIFGDGESIVAYGSELRPWYPT